MATIAVLGTFDTKGQEHGYVAAILRQRGHRTILIDVGTAAPPAIVPDITREAVAEHAGLPLADLVARQDRGECVAAMAQAGGKILQKLVKEGQLDGVISLGGGGGTAIGTAAMRALPIGIPKLMVSTLAAGNTAPYLGTKDIVMFPSMVDINGLNRFSKQVLAKAAGAMCGMVETQKPDTSDEKPLIAASMFGNTTQCVTDAQRRLEQAGYEVLVFHATGAGGRLMESLIEGRTFVGVLDITTTEWADEFVGGTLSAGPTRLDAAAKAGIPTIITPGCLDMVNFGEPHTVPAKFAGRTFYYHNPQVTLMRTNAAECWELGKILAEKANACREAVAVFLPTKGVSVISAAGQPFYSPEADEALFSSIQKHLSPDIPLHHLDFAINDPQFSMACADTLIQMLAASTSPPMF